MMDKIWLKISGFNKNSSYFLRALIAKMNSIPIDYEEHTRQTVFFSADIFTLSHLTEVLHPSAK